MKSKAAVLVALMQPLEIMELGVPALRPGQVLVKIAYSGLCRTQLNEIKGFKGADSYLPHTLGHEGSGIVMEVGREVRKVKPGDHVVLSWIKGSGIDAGGCQYDSERGFVNSGPISTFLQYAVVSENRLISVSADLSLREAALLGCALPTGAGAVLNQMQLCPGQSLAVFGTGGVGLSAILAGNFLKAGLICAIDIHDTKLEKALEMGATHVVNAKREQVLEAIKVMTGGRKIDCVFECVGTSQAMETAFEVTADSGVCVLAGNLPAGNRIAIDPFDLIRGKRLLGSWGGGTDIDRDMQKYIDLCRFNACQFNQLITHEVELDGVNCLLDELECGKVGRGLVKFY